MILDIGFQVGIVKDIQNLKSSIDDQSLKICEEAEEVYDAVTNNEDREKIVEECCDTITACIGMLYRLGLDSKGIAKAMWNVTQKNSKRGYLSDEL